MKHCIQTLFLTVKGSCVQNCPEHFLWTCSVLDHCSLRSQISSENGNASVRSDGIIIRTDNILSGKIYIVASVKFVKPSLTFFIETVSSEFLQVFTKGFACNSHNVQMQMLLNFFHNCRNTSCIVEALCRPPTGRTYIQKITGISVQPVKGISCDLNAKLMGNGRNMKKAVGASGYSRMNQNGIFKTFFCDDLAWTHPRHSCKLYCLLSCLPCIFQKIRTCCRHQSTSRKSKSQSLCHNLHGGRSSDKRTCAAAWTGVALGPLQLFLINFSPFIFCAVHAKLLQSKHLRSGIHGSARNHYRRYICSCQTHQISRHPLVTACQINACIERSCIRMNFNHIGDHFPTCQTIIDSVCSLAFSVADISTEITCAMTSGLFNSFTDFLHQNIQMSASRMAVSKSTFNNHLGLGKIFRLPACSNTKRIQLRSYFSHFLTY